MTFHNFDYTALSAQEEQSLFFSMLYHDSRNGQIIRLIKGRDGKVGKTFSTFDTEKLGCTGTDGNVYMSVNTFRGKTRKPEQLFNRTAFFLDLDYHHYGTYEELEQVLQNTKQILEKAYDDGELAVPTCILYTGRGFAIYYILEHSIANVESSQKSLKHFEKVYGRLCRRYQEVLEKADKKLLCEVDMKVMDAPRIARMPGTVNHNVGQVCHLISINHKEDGTPLYYDINQIINGCSIKMNNEAQTDEAKIFPIKMVTEPFLATRIHRMEILRDLRGEGCVDECREMMCFITYSALTQIYPRLKALKLLHDFNDGFTTPLPESELDHIIEGTDSHVVPEGRYEGCKGFYPYSDNTIIKVLDLNDDEIRAAGFGQSWKRQRKKEENQKKKSERNKEIITLIQENPEMTYAVIAEKVGVSDRTVERVAKANGVNRYQTKSSVSEKPATVREASEVRAEIIVFPNDESIRDKYVTGQVDSSKEGMKTDKNFYESWCVCTSILPVCVVSSLQEQGWGGAASRFQSLLAQVAKTKHIEFIEEIDHYMDSQFTKYADLSPSVMLSTIESDMTNIAIWLTNYNYGLPQPKNSPVRMTGLGKTRSFTWKRKKSAVPKDQRFVIVKRMMEKEHRNIPKEVYVMVKKVFKDIWFIKKDTFMIKGRGVPMTEIRECFESLSYRDIVVICEHIGSKDFQAIVQPIYYVVKCVWTYRHPEDSFTDEQEKAFTEKQENKNAFHNFNQRDDYDWDKLERMLLEKNHL